MSTQNTTAAPPTPSASLQADGYVPGAPPQVNRKALKIDAQTARRLVCPICHHRGMTAAPYQKGDDYRSVARCDRCGHEVEV